MKEGGRERRLLTLLRGCIGEGRRRFYMIWERFWLGIGFHRWNRLLG